ncbi:MAG: S8 family serine peptidase [Bacteroidetes bacterium]|jgi:hypothetical protein|nr:S8 family serine peptidase [Bacteroidota bacterium]
MSPFQLLWSIFSALCLSILFTFSLHGQQSDGAFSFRFAEIPQQQPRELWQKGPTEDHILVKFNSHIQSVDFPVAKSHFLGNNTFLMNKKIWKQLEQSVQHQIQSWAPYKKDYKIHPDFSGGPSTISHLEVVLDKSLSYSEWASAFHRQAIPVEKHLPGSHFVVIENAPGRLETLQSMPEVVFIHSGGRWSEPEDLRAKRLHSSIQLEDPYGNALGLDGSGVHVQVRDDGIIGPHLDFKGRLINDPQLPFDTTGTHGDGVAGILAGAGNLEGKARGMAPGAIIYGTQYESSFLDNTLNLHIEEDVLYTNSSYSNGCNNGYTPNAAEVDRQIYTYPTYLHVFSAGNSNNNNCGYGAGSQWGNVTGGHKQAKNAIATANVNPEGLIQASSSRGPATDGRIKPDIAANGAQNYSTRPNNKYNAFGGTSGAAPCVVGVAAQLNQAYTELNGQDAPSALIKAAMLNGARDSGEPGPDFIFGFGLLDAFNAYEILANDQFISESISNNQTREYTIDIPANMDKAKIMLYWADPPAAPMAQKALVNDLDLEVDFGGDTFLPLVPDPTPDREILSSPAAPGVDRLNNVEQVVLQANGGGTATLRVKGWDINFGQQDFHLVYTFVNDEGNPAFRWESPRPGEILELENRLRLVWDSEFTTTQDRRLSYSLNGGQSWTEQNIFVPFDFLMLNLADPKPQNGDSVIVAYADANITDTLWEPVYFGTPHEVDEVSIETVCIDSLTVSWSSKPNAKSYQLYAMADKFMEGQITTSDTFATIPISNPVEQNLFAVRTNYGNGVWSDRRIATLFEGGLLDCPQNRELAMERVETKNQIQGFTCAPFQLELEVEIANKGLERADSFQICYQIDDLDPICEWVTDRLEAEEVLNYTFDSTAFIDQNYAHLTSWVRFNGDRFVWNDTIKQNFPIRFLTEDVISPTMNLTFERSGLPSGTQIVTDDEEFTWRLFEATDKRQDNSTMLVMPNFFYEDVGQVDNFFSPVINMDSTWNEAELIFEYAYSAIDLSPDSLYVLALDPCGLAVIDTLWVNGGENMATTENGFGAFQPTSFRDWSDARIPIGHLKNRDIIISFTSVNGFGNNLWINKPSIVEDDSYIHTVNISVDPKAVCQDSLTELTAQINGPHMYTSEWIIPELQSKLSGRSIDYRLGGAGPRSIVSLVSNEFYTRITEDTIRPIQGVELNIETERIGDTIQLVAQTVDADSISWQTNRGFTFSGNRVSYVGSPGEGVVVFTVTAYGTCGPVSESVEVEFNVSSDLSNPTAGTILYPNPSSEGPLFIQNIDQDMARKMRGLRWLNAAGQIVHETENIKTVENGAVRIPWPTRLGPAFYILDMYDQQGQSMNKWKVIRQ